jgi:hypothetical protein
MFEDAFHLGSARASRANFGALAEIFFVEVGCAVGEAPTAAREGACAPQRLQRTVVVE